MSQGSGKLLAPPEGGRWHAGTDAAHADEIARLRTHASSDHLSPLETKAVLTAVELLEGHMQGRVRLCELPHVQSLVSLCLGEPFVVHAGDACGCGSDG